jgi:transposase
MSAKYPSSRDFCELEARRRRAADLFRAGWSQAAVARELGVTPAATCHWYRAWRVGGADDLKARAGKPGRKPKVAVHGWIKGLASALEKSPKGDGFRSWTLDCVVQFIWRHTGTQYHRGHVWRLMRRHNMVLRGKPSVECGRQSVGAPIKPPQEGAAQVLVELCIRRCGRSRQPGSKFCRECLASYRVEGSRVRNEAIDADCGYHAR